MRFQMLLLTFLAFALGCAGTETPTLKPETVSTPSVSEPSPEGAPMESTSMETSAATVPGALASQGPGNPEAQCQAGGAQACRTLCEVQAAVCDKDSDRYNKDTCKDVSREVPLCPTEVDDVTLGRLCRLAPSRLSPTQGAVGRLAVSCKSRSLEDKQAGKPWKLRRYLMARPVPVVLASGDRFFLTDRHHLSTALFDTHLSEDDKLLYVCPMADRASQTPEAFWSYMENNNFTWLHNSRGERIPPAELPAQLGDLGDDPFRTLSRWVRDSCGYIKCGKKCGGNGDDTSKLARCEACAVAPYFLEFRWADYLRGQQHACGITDGVYTMSLPEQATVLPPKLSCLMDLASQPAALELGLPGWNHGLIQTKDVVLDANGCEQ